MLHYVLLPLFVQCNWCSAMFFALEHLSLYIVKRASCLYDCCICLYADLHVLHCVSYPISCTDHVVMIWNNCCAPWLSLIKNLKKLLLLLCRSMVAHYNVRSFLYKSTWVSRKALLTKAWARAADSFAFTAFNS